MKVETIEALEQLLKLCHRLNVHAMEIDGMRFNLTPSGPTDAPRQQSETKQFVIDGTEATEEEVAWFEKQKSLRYGAS